MEAEDNRSGSKAMTDEERKKLNRIRLESLVKDLHGIAKDEDESDPYIATRCQFAANEIERLAEENEAYANHCDHLRADVIRLGKEKRRKT
jgi:hypothetical protein